MNEELAAIVDLNPSRLNPLELTVLKFARKVLLQATDLEAADFEALRKQGLGYGDIVRIVTILAWTVGSSIISNAFESAPEMPEFAKGIRKF